MTQTESAARKRRSPRGARWLLQGLVGVGLVLASACLDEPAAPVKPGDDGNPGVPGDIEPEPSVEPDLSHVIGGKLILPIRLTPTPAGRLVVSDFYARRVFLVDPPTLRVLGGLVVQGGPLAVGLWGRRIFVGNAATRTVDVYDHRGAYLYSFGGGPGAVGDPTDLAIDAARGLVFVVDGRSRVVKVFTVYGDPVFQISGPGQGAARLQRPTGIALHADQVFVSDYGDLRTGDPARIKVFEYDGKLVTSLSGGNDGSKARFARPQGLTVDAQRRVFVTEAMSGEVIVLDPATGAVIKTIGTWGSDPGQLRLPLDVTLSPRSDAIFVTNSRNGRVELFAGGGAVP